MNKNLTKIVKSLRKHTALNNDFNTPISITEDLINTGLKRRRVVLNTYGCTVPTCTMCPLPNESIPKNIELTNQNLINQINRIFTVPGQIDILTVYHNGNFFSKHEISLEVKKHLFKLCHANKIKSLVVESLPSLVNREELDLAKHLMPNTILEIAVGLQSCNDFIREQFINSSCTYKKFIETYNLVKEYNYKLQVFLMFSPPFLSQEESINDLEESIFKLNKLGIDDLIICPLRISPNTLVQKMYLEGYYELPQLVNLLKALKNVYVSNKDAKCRVAISLLYDSDSTVSLRTSSTILQDEIIEALRYFNNAGSFNTLFNDKFNFEPIKPSNKLEDFYKLSFKARLDLIIYMFNT